MKYLKTMNRSGPGILMVPTILLLGHFKTKGMGCWENLLLASQLPGTTGAKNLYESVPSETIPAQFILFREEKRKKRKEKKGRKYWEHYELRVMKSLKCKKRCAIFSRDYVKKHPKLEKADSSHISFDGGKIGHMRPQTCKQNFQHRKLKTQNFSIMQGYGC